MDGIGKVLRRLRESAGLTQSDLADRADVALNTVTGIEQGSIKNPGIITVRSLARELGVSLDAFDTGPAAPEPCTVELTHPDLATKGVRRVIVELGPPDAGEDGKKKRK